MACKINLSLLMALDAVCSKVEVLLLFICCLFIVAPIVCGGGGVILGPCFVLQ